MCQACSMNGELELHSKYWSGNLQGWTLGRPSCRWKVNRIFRWVLEKYIMEVKVKWLITDQWWAFNNMVMNLHWVLWIFGAADQISAFQGRTCTTEVTTDFLWNYLKSKFYCFTMHFNSLDLFYTNQCTSFIQRCISP